MNTRNEKLLTYVVEHHIDKATPVGSKEVAESGLFKVSSATIRNAMAELEEEGYLFQPHTSAGRIPTDRGYRFYVDKLLSKPKLNQREQDFLKKRMVSLENKMDQLMRYTARALADASHDAALSYSEADREAYASGISNLLKKPEFREGERAYEIAELFDDPERYLERLPHSEGDGKIQVYIGDESPTGKKLNCSFIVSEFNDVSGGKHYMALIGPTRMNYKQNIRLMRYITELLSGGMLAAILIINL